MATKRKPIMSKRMTEALFEKGWMEKELGGSSSGSDHLPSGSLSDLVNSFIQKVDEEETPINEGGDEEGDADVGELGNNSSGIDERKGFLKKLLGYGDDDDYSVAEFRRNVIQEIEVGFQDQISISCRELGFKRRLMVHLRERGYDAGLCKSRWEKTERYPAGTYEYVDIITSCGRYIVEAFPAAQFEIARPTVGYRDLQEEFPHIFIGKPETLKQMVRVMSAAMKESLRSSALEVAPWRRNGYLQAQWFAAYKRTTNTDAAPAGSHSHQLPSQPSTMVGFVEELSLPASQGAVYNYCSRQFSSKGGIRIGLLSASLQGK